MIVALAGRRIDATDAERPVFPLTYLDAVKSRLIETLRDEHVRHIISSGACGADLVAMEAAETLGISKTMILPFKADTFKTTSVTDRPGNWGPIFDKCVKELKESGNLVELNMDKEDPDVYTTTNFFLLDEAEKIASELDSNKTTSSENKMAVIIWEGKPRSTGDTTYHFMQEAQKRKFIIKEIRSNE